MSSSSASQANWNKCVCGGCGTLCDDIVLSDSDSFQVRVQESPNLCPLGKQWFQSGRTSEVCRVSGSEAEIGTAISMASRLIKASQMPLMGGLEGLSTTAQQAAWRLADRNRMMVDSSWINRGRGESVSVQQIGHVTATLGEIAERSDLSIYWYCDPASTNPRHLERFERPDRERIVVDEKRTETGKQPVEFLLMDRHRAGVAVNVLQGLLADIRLDANRVQQMTGHSLEVWREILMRIQSSRYVAIYTSAGSRLDGIDSDFDSEAEGLAKLVRCLNSKTRVVSLALRHDQNGVGAENVLAWSSGYPFAVNLNRGYPRFFGKEFSLETVLERKECDLIFLASTANLNRAWEQWSPEARNHFSTTQKVVLASEEYSIPGHVAVEIPVARCGVSCNGDHCRQDNISIAMPMVDQSLLESPERILELLDFA